MNLVCHLREIRGDRSLTDVAADAGVSKATLSQIERGVMTPLEKHIAPMERAYGSPIVSWYSKRALLALQEGDSTGRPSS